MQVEYTGRKVVVTKKLKTQAEAGLARIAKIIGDAGSAHVVLSAEKYRQTAEVTVQTRHLKLVAKCISTEMETALHDALSKVEGQAVKNRKRKTTLKHHPKTKKDAIEMVAPEPVPVKKVSGKSAAKASNGKATGGSGKTVPMLVHSFPSKSPLVEPHITRSADGVALRPMTLEEAVKEAAFRDREVFVFRDKKGAAMVLHRKRDGNMELIEVP